MKFRSYLIIGLLSLSACAQSGQNTANKNQAKKTENSTDVAERLVDEGEAVFSFDSVLQAQDKFHAALATDPENARAKFWVATTDLLFQFRGILVRAEPYLMTEPGVGARYKRFKLISENPNNPNPAAHFLVDGPVDIKTAADFADWIDQIRNAVSRARIAMHEIRNNEITITIPKTIGNTSARGDCGPLSFGPIKFQISEEICGTDGPLVFGLNAGDFDQMAQVLSYFELTLDLLTAYRFNPTAVITNLNHPINSRADAEDYISKLFTGADERGVPYDGGLRRPLPFYDIHAIGAQMLVALKYQQQNQATLCPMGYSSQNNRRGYLFSAGNCIRINETSTDRERSLETLRALVAGRPVDANDGSATIDYSELADNPPANLKDLIFPLKVDACGKIRGLNTEAFPKIFRKIDDEKVFHTSHCASRMNRAVSSVAP